MSNVHHRPGVREEFLVKRQLKLQTLDEARADVIAEEVDGLTGVDSTELNASTGRLDIAYDATHLDLEQVYEILRKHDSGLERGWWNRFKDKWYRFTDQNIRDNARHIPNCCSKPPPGK